MRNQKYIMLSILILSGLILAAVGLHVLTDEIAEREITLDEWSQVDPEDQQDDSSDMPSDILTNTYLITDTNQTSCTNSSTIIDCPDSGSFFGQDAQYSGHIPNYTDNGDGTVTDNVTGLMWQKTPAEKSSYQQAVSASESFELAGYSDWRVPTIKELYSLMDFSGVDPIATGSNTNGLKPFINNTYFDFEYGNTSNGDRIIDSQWITSNIYKSKVMNNQQCFFGVNFADGRIKCYPTSSTRNNGYFVRYVRGNTDYGKNDFVANEQTVSDRSTGLQWQLTDSGKGMNWEQALAYCESAVTSGLDDWRLPNAKELQSIIDYSRSPDTTSSAALDSLFQITEIQNEAGDKDYPFFWTSTTHFSQSVGYEAAVYISFGRALGYMQDFGGWVDVHGAGAQRSDPKSGDATKFPNGRGPQGDAIRIENYVRCVRGGDIEPNSAGDDDTSVSVNDQSITIQPQVVYPPGTNTNQPPNEAITACNNKDQGATCTIRTPNSKLLSGHCEQIGSNLACVPDEV